MKNSTKNLLQRFLKNDATTLLLRLALLYILWFLCRIVFYLQNAGLVGPLEWNEIPGLLRGAGMFDTASILYVNALFILLSLLPFRFRETRRYQRILCWLYTVTNALALIVNSADGIYFHYARKRFTSDELSYLHNNDNTGTVVLKGLAENWYIVLWCALLIAAMVWVYRRIKAMPTRIENRWAYFGINLAVLAVAIGLVMGGIRGGFSRQTRPITLSNATLYTASNLKANLILSNPFCLIRTLGNKAIEALPSILSSIPSYETPFVLLPQAVAPMDALPKILHDEGYGTSFFNGSARGSMGFGAYASQAGIQHYYSREDYEQAQGTGDFDGYWGIWDEPFLQYMARQLNTMPQPFFASVFTLTSHHPFVVPEQYRNTLPAGKTKVHKGVAYTDLAIRRFMETASQESWYDHTIFVFVADHVSSETFAPKTLTPTGNSHIICLLYTPDGAIKGSDARVTQQIDLMPTLLGLTGYAKPYFAFGRDVLRENDRAAMAVNMTGENYQAITDSLVLFFDGHKTVSAYARTDTLQRHDIASERTSYLEQVERDLKARLQQYYQHVEKSDYLVKEDSTGR